MTFRKISFLALISLLATCGGSKLDESSSSGYLIGGEVTRLTSGTLTLRNVSANQNKTEDLSVTATGAFTFSQSFPASADYNVTVVAEPAGLKCLVTAGVGKTVNSNIDGIKIACYNDADYTIAGTLSGASVSITLRNNKPDGSAYGPDLIIPANGPFSFPDKVTNTNIYDVIIVADGTDNCTISNESGQVIDADVTNIAVTCTAGGGPSTYTIGGSVSGMTGGTLILQNDQLDAKIIGADGAYNFSTQYSDAQAYTVTVTSQPASQFCTVTNATGSIPTANVTNIIVTCAENIAPSFLSSTPTNGSLNVPVIPVITANFSDNSGSMNAATVAGQVADGPCTGGLQLSSNGFATCVGGVTNSAANPTFTFTPSTPLTVNTLYQYRIMNTVQDSNNNLICCGPYTYSFTTVPADISGTIPVLTSAIEVGWAEVALTYPAHPDADGYQIHRSPPSASTPSGATQINTTSSVGYTDHTAPLGVTSYYQIVATNAFPSTSNGSNEIAVAVSNPAPPASKTILAETAVLGGTIIMVFPIPAAGVTSVTFDLMLAGDLNSPSIENVDVNVGACALGTHINGPGGVGVQDGVLRQAYEATGAFNMATGIDIACAPWALGGTVTVTLTSTTGVNILYTGFYIQAQGTLNYIP